MPSKKLEASYVDYAYQFLEQLKVVQLKSEHTVRCYTTDLNKLKEFLENKTFEIPDLQNHLPWKSV